MRFKVKTSLLPMGYRNNKQKGFTLIELLLVLGLFAIIGALAMSFYISSTKVMVQGSRQSDLQYNITLTSKAITDELLYATDIKFHPSIPASFDGSRRYIYVQDNAIKHRGEGENNITNYNSSTPGRTYTLNFISSDGNSLDFTVSAQEAGQNYSIQSAVQPLNPVSIPISAEGFPVISYKTSINRISFFALLKEKNPDLDNDIYGIIYKPTGNTKETAGEIFVDVNIDANHKYTSRNDLAGLVPTFIATGGIVKVDTVTQVSGTTVQNFSKDPETDPVYYEVIANEGTAYEEKVYYKVKVSLISSTTGNPRAAFVGIYSSSYIFTNDKLPANWKTTDENSSLYPPEANDFIVEQGADIQVAYKYEANGSAGTEGATTCKLLQNSPENLNEFNKELNIPVTQEHKEKGIINIKLPNDKVYKGKAYKVSVTAKSISENGVVTEAVLDIDDTNYGGYSRNTIAVKDDNISDFMKDFVNQKDLLFKYKSKQKTSFDTEGIAFTITSGADNSNGTSNILKDMTKYLAKFKYEDEDEVYSYRIIVDAKLEQPSNAKPGGYGVLIGGYVNKGILDIYDSGYMIQFDPGADNNKGAFLIRKMHGTFHFSSTIHGVDKMYKPADFCQGNEGSNGYDFRGATCGESRNASNFDWYKRYTMEIIVQKRATTSDDMTIRVRLYYTDPKTGETFHSNDMWFGNFGKITYDQTFKGKSLSYNNKTAGNYFGIRTWVNKDGIYKKGTVDNKFYNIDIKPGWTLYATSAFTAQDKIDLKFYQYDDAVIKNKREEPKISLDTYDKKLIKILVGEVNNNSNNTLKYPYNHSTTTPTDTLTLHLNKPPSMEQLKHEESGTPSALFISQGAFRQQYAGLVRISALPEENMEEDKTQPTFTSSLSNNNETITIKFSEPMAYDSTEAINALTTASNYTFIKSGDDADEFLLDEAILVITPNYSRKDDGFNPDGVTLSLKDSKKFDDNTTVKAITNVTDVAGNSL